MQPFRIKIDGAICKKARLLLGDHDISDTVSAFRVSGEFGSLVSLDLVLVPGALEVEGDDVRAVRAFLPEGDDITPIGAEFHGFRQVDEESADGS